MAFFPFAGDAAAASADVLERAFVAVVTGNAVHVGGGRADAVGAEGLSACADSVRLVRSVFQLAGGSIVGELHEAAARLRVAEGGQDASRVRRQAGFFGSADAEAFLAVVAVRAGVAVVAGNAGGQGTIRAGGGTDAAALTRAVFVAADARADAASALGVPHAVGAVVQRFLERKIESDVASRWDWRR